MISHRNLSNDDLETICSFPQNREELFYISPKFEYPLTPDQILKLLENRKSPTVVVDSDINKPTAYANLLDLNDDESCCWLGNVIVSQQYRGKGIADYLIKTMLNKAKNEHGLSKVKLYCHNTNTRALLFYTKQGFIPCGSQVILNYDNKKIVAIEMEIDL